MSDEKFQQEEMEACSKVEDAASREELLNELAQCLKKARKARQLSPEEIALTLKLRPVYIECLESGDWSEMPGEVYALGFLKQYASFLGVDVSDSIEKLKTGQYKLTKPLTFPDPPIAPNKTWVIVAALAFVVVLILFNLIGEEPIEEHALPTPAISEVNTLTASTDIPAPITDGAEQNEQESVTSENPPVDEPVVTESPAVEHEYKLSAVDADVWLQLHTEENPDESTAPLREALLHAGESISVYHASPYLILTCGNPIALEVEIDGTRVISAGSLGQSGKVLHNFKLHADNE